MSSNYEILEQTPVSQSEVKDLIEQRTQEVEELSYREEKSLEYLKHLDVLSFEDYQKAFEEIKALNLARLEDLHIVKILDLMPENGTQLRLIVANSGTVLVDESVSSILDILAKYK